MSADEKDDQVSSVPSHIANFHFCPIAGCEKSVGKGWKRSDKVVEHLFKAHADLGYVKNGTYYSDDEELDIRIHRGRASPAYSVESSDYVSEEVIGETSTFREKVFDSDDEDIGGNFSYTREIREITSNHKTRRPSTRTKPRDELERTRRELEKYKEQEKLERTHPKSDDSVGSSDRSKLVSSESPEERRRYISGGLGGGARYFDKYGAEILVGGIRPRGYNFLADDSVKVVQSDAGNIDHGSNYAQQRDLGPNETQFEERLKQSSDYPALDNVNDPPIDLEQEIGGLNIHDNQQEESREERKRKDTAEMVAIAARDQVEIMKRMDERNGAIRKQIFSHEEEAALRQRLRERQMPKRRVSAGGRRHRVLYDDGVYRWE